MVSGFTRLRAILWVVVAAVALSATGLYLFTTNRQTAGFGVGDYALVTADGNAFSRASFNGHPSALFFGFTHCPEVCPTTLAEMTTWFEQLGEEAGALEAYFVTVDPERDTAAVIGDYVAWTGAVTGVTGPREEIDKAIKAWAIYAKKIPLENGDYTMDHTASVFLLDRDGNFQGTIAYREDSKTAVEKLRRLIAG